MQNSLKIWATLSFPFLRLGKWLNSKMREHHFLPKKSCVSSQLKKISRFKSDTIFLYTFWFSFSRSLKFQYHVVFVHDFWHQICWNFVNSKCHYDINPLNPNISLMILRTVCYTVLVMLVWRICYWINL